jgi:hypothetical protein
MSQEGVTSYPHQQLQRVDQDAENLSGRITTINWAWQTILGQNPPGRNDGEVRDFAAMMFEFIDNSARDLAELAREARTGQLDYIEKKDDAA